MSLQFHEEADGKILTVCASDRLTKEDYDRFVPEVERLIGQHGRIRVLFDMRDFHGWTARALWEDIKFDLHHFNDIERLAMIGETRWQDWMATFCRPFTTAKIRYFEHNEADEARTWLQST